MARQTSGFHSLSVFGLLFIGLVAGWLATLITDSGGLYIVMDLLAGVIGATMGGYLLNLSVVQTGGFFASLVAATIGAIVALLGVGMVKRFVELKCRK